MWHQDRDCPDLPQKRNPLLWIQPSLAEDGVDAVIRRILNTANAVVTSAILSHSSLSDIAIAAGAIDSDKGTVTDSPNLPSWHNNP